MLNRLFCSVKWAVVKVNPHTEICSYVVSLSLLAIEYTNIVWGLGNGYSVAQHIYQRSISFVICWSTHIFYTGLLVTVLHLAVL